LKSSSLTLVVLTLPAYHHPQLIGILGLIRQSFVIMSDSESESSVSDVSAVEPAPAEPDPVEQPAQAEPQQEASNPTEAEQDQGPPPLTVDTAHPDDALAEYRKFMEPLAEKSPEYGATGLVTLWEAHHEDDSSPGGSIMVPDFE
jgi:hypothetical protein